MAISAAKADSQLKFSNFFHKRLHFNAQHLLVLCDGNNYYLAKKYHKENI